MDFKKLIHYFFLVLFVTYIQLLEGSIYVHIVISLMIVYVLQQWFLLIDKVDDNEKEN